MGLMESRREIINNEPSVQEVKGNAYKIETDVKGKLNDFKLEFMAQQEGSGTPSENNVRTIIPCSSLTWYQGGRSVVPFVANSLTNTTNLANGHFNFGDQLDVNLLPNKIWLTYSADIDNTNNLEDQTEASYVSVWHHKLNGGYNYSSDTVTIPPHQKGRSYTYIVLNAEDHDWVGFGYTLRKNSTISNPMVEIGWVQHDYEPYNVSKTKIQFPSLSKNLFDISTLENKTGITISGNEFYGSARDFRTQTTTLIPMYIPKGTTFRVHAKVYSEGNYNTAKAGWSIYFYYEDGTSIRPWYTKNSDTTETYYTGELTAEEDIVSWGIGWFDHADNIWHVKELQIEVGTTDTAFEPFNNQYGGGYIEPLTGNFVETYRYATITDVTNYQSEHDYGYWYSTANDLHIPIIDSTNADLTIDRLKVNDVTSGTSSTEGGMTFYENGIIRWQEQTSMTKEEYQAYLVEHPIHIVYKLKTPIVHKVPIIVPKQLKGANSFWSNDGQVNVKYYKH